MTAAESQLKDLIPLPIEDCWNKIGVQGNSTCQKLKEVIHCRHCPVYSAASLRLLDRPLLPDYRRAWTEHFAREKALPAPAKTSALVFRISTEWLALPAETFQEVTERRFVHSLPHRQRTVVLGLANVRGELVICVSLGHLLGLVQRPLRSARPPTYDWLLVANWNGHRFVFPADEVHGIHRFQATELTEPPATLSKSSSSFVQGVFQWQGQGVGLLEADRLFTAINQGLA